jgi:hypothetical protein
MTRGTALQRLLTRWLKLSNADHFEHATWSPRRAQEQKLTEIVSRSADTAFGRAHGFGRIRGIRDFQSQVPPQTYESLQPYVERAMRGEPAVLTAEEPVMFVTTSGTTGRVKYIPVTPSYLHEYSHGLHVHTYRVLADFEDILEGRVLVSSSNDVEGTTESGRPYGAISGYLTRTQPAFLRRSYVVPYEVCRVKQIDLKYYLTLRHGLAADVRYIVTPNPSSLLLLADKMTAHAGELIHDIRHGTLTAPGAAALPGPSGRLAADSRRAAELAAILRRTGRLTPREVWPNLRMLSCWKGGTMPLYLRRLPEHFGDVPVRDLGYMASEGRGATPLVNAGAGGVVSLTSHFFEFVPEDQRGSPAARFLTCDELEANREYYVYFTTSGGLYRYDINDLVRVVDFYHHTPVIEFVRKGEGITSITGEKLTESQVTDALLEVTGRHGFDLRHFTACVEWSDPPFYAMYGEVAEGWTQEHGRRFLREMDRALCRRNIEYESKRDSGRLGRPVLRRVADGTYQELRQRRVAQGAPEAQVKLPHLSTSMQFGDQLRVLEEYRVEREGSEVAT